MKAKKTNLRTAKGRKEAAELLKQLQELRNKVADLYNLEDLGGKDNYLAYRAQQADFEFGDALAGLKFVLEEANSRYK